MRRSVAVILVNYKGARDTAHCVQSLLGCPEIPRLVVVDNTPNDPDLEGAIAPYPGAHLIRAPENLGFGRGNNLGIEWALENTNCEFIFILNNDATIEAETITKLVRAMNAHPEAGIVVPRILFADDPSKLWYGGGEVDWKKVGAVVPGIFGPSTSTTAMTSRYVSFATGCAMMVRRDVFQTIGFFDPKYFMYEEDLEFSIRLKSIGKKIYYYSCAIVNHKCQGSQRQDESDFLHLLHKDNPNLPFFIYHLTKNKLITRSLHARGINKIKAYFIWPVYWFLKGVQYARHHRWDAIRGMLRGLKDGMKANS